MEPMVIFSAGLVVYCGYLTWLDALRDRKRHRATRTEKVREKKPYPARRAPVISADRSRGDAGGVHWPVLLKGSA